MNLYVKALATIDNLPIGTIFEVKDLLSPIEWSNIVINAQNTQFGRDFKSIMVANSNLFNVRILPPNGSTQRYEKI